MHAITVAPYTELTVTHTSNAGCGLGCFDMCDALGRTLDVLITSMHRQPHLPQRNMPAHLCNEIMHSIFIPRCMHT